MEHLSGTAIRGYYLHELIGEGGFGAVYRATQSAVERDVVIKIILPQHASRPEFIRRFEAEAQLVARLEHLHIVPLYDYWRDPEGAYLVMRWLRGGTLRDSLKKGAWPPRATSHLLNQISAALMIAHRNGIIHRDVKPTNILLDEERNAYLSDFGIALDNVSKSAGGSERLSGTAAYISPEQINIREVTPQSDIYSLGIMLWEMLMGAHPYADAKSSVAMFVKHVHEPLPAMTGFPDSLQGVIHKAAAKNPQDRYTDLLELAAAFRAAVAEMDPTRRDTAPQLLEDFDSSSFELTPTPDAHAIPNPYKGLRAFQESDASDFFGREALVDQLLGRFAEDHPPHRFLAVVGPSGSGKSSVVKAGLLPALRKDGLPGSSDWYIVEMVPGVDPLKELEGALLRVATRPLGNVIERLQTSPKALHDLLTEALPPASQVVLVVDQFEEAFTLVTDAERDALLSNLHYAVTNPDSALRVITTLRADFYDRPLMIQNFSTLMQQRTEVVIPLTADELERAITSPARRVKVFFQQGLAAAIVSEVADQPGVLPMLQYALTELFERREGGLITQKPYQELGGVLGALARRAEEIYNALPSEQQEAARQLFLRLVSLGEGTEDTRRRTLQSELLSATADPKIMQQVIDTFGGYRLLTFDRDPISRTRTVEVAHEALIREWRRLRDWLDESREDVRLQRLLAAAAQEWYDNQQDASFLLRGGRLVQFEDWAQYTSVSLTERETHYLNMSTAEHRRLNTEEENRRRKELELQRQSQQRLRILVAVMSIAFLISIAGGFLILQERDAAQSARAEAQTQAALAAQNAGTATSALGQAEAAAVEANDARATSVANAVAVQREADNASTQQANAQAAAADANIARATSDANAQVAQNEADNAAIAQSTAFAAATAAQANADNAATQQANAQAAAADANIARATSDANAQVAQNEANNAATQQANAERQFEAAQSLSLAASADELSGSNSPLALALAIAANEVDDPEQRAQQVLASAVYEAPRRRFTPASSSISSIALTNDNQRLIVGGVNGSVSIWSVESGQPLSLLGQHEAPVTAVVLNAENTLAASASQDGRVLVWDLATGGLLQTLIGHTGAVNAIAFHPTRPELASGGSDAVVNLWNLQTGAISSTLSQVSTNNITALDYAPDGANLMVIFEDSLRVWNFSSREYLTFLNPLTRARAGRFSPDGFTILTSGGAASGTPDLWDIRSFRREQGLVAHNGAVNVVAFHPSGQLVVSGADDFTLILATTGGQAVRHFAAHNSPISGVAFSSDGRRIYSADRSGVIYEWDAAPPEALTIDVALATVGGAAFTQDGTQILANADDGTISLYDLSTGASLLSRRVDRTLVAQTRTVMSPLSSPDAMIVLWGSLDLRLINLTTGEELQRFSVPEERAWLQALAISPDGRYAVWGGGYYFRDQLPDFTRAGILRLWDLQTGELLRDFGGHTVELTETVNTAITAVAFTPDGTQIVSGAEDGSLILWDIASGARMGEFSGHSGEITQIAFHPTSNRMATASADRSMILWNLNTGAPVQRFSGHTSIVRSIAFNAAGDLLLSGGQDAQILLWDLNGQVIQRLGANNVPITTVAFSPDEQFVLAGDINGRLTLWTIDTVEGLIAFARENRYFPDLTCDLREQYRVFPHCATATATTTP